MIVVSAVLDDDYRDTLAAKIDPPARETLDKPVDPDRLCTLMEQALEA